jgi:methyl coenzyme M reductase subunit C-like uncharacterized protein (methanogenesis marker protein 7)
MRNAVRFDEKLKQAKKARTMAKINDLERSRAQSYGLIKIRPKRAEVAMV